MPNSYYLDQIFSQLQTGILLNFPKSGHKWTDMILIPLFIGFIGSFIHLLRLKFTGLVEYLKCLFSNIDQHAAKIDFEGSIHYLTYRTRVQLDLGMAAFLYHIYKNIEQVEGLKHFRRIPDQNRDLDETNDINILNSPLFEEFFIAQEKMIKLPSGIKIYPKIQSRSDSDDNSITNKNNIKSSIYGITVVCDIYKNSDKNIKYLLDFYKKLKDEYLEHRDNKINNSNQYVYVFDHKTDDRVYFDRYSIKNEPKCINHIWFPEKTELVKSIQHFINNPDFYHEKGKPYRKVILAHGEPGCGKTSFLMALLNMLKCNRQKYPRQLIHLKLDALTRKDLMNILFKETISIDSTAESSIKIPFDRRIYYIEEIDTYDMTHKRDADSTDINTITKDELLTLLRNIESGGGSKSNITGKEKDDLKSIVSDDSDDSDDSDRSSSSFKQTKPTKRKRTKKKENEEINYLLKSMIGPLSSDNNQNHNKLGLQDILEALDGIPSMKHGEIVFMTTNHIEKIDPALIRPGRVNHLINFRKATRENTIFQIEKYYGTKLSNLSKLSKLSNKSQINVSVSQSNIPDMKWTPAQIDAFCDSSNTIEEIINKLI